MDITISSAIDVLILLSNQTPVSPLQDTPSRNVYKIMVSPNANSNLCFTFTPLSSGEVVGLLFIMLALESILINLSDSRDHNWPRTWCFGRLVGANTRVLSQAHFPSTGTKGGHPMLYFEFVRTKTNPSAWCYPIQHNAHPTPAQSHFPFWVGL